MSRAPWNPGGQRVPPRRPLLPARSLSVEKLARRAKWQMVFWRFVGDLLEFPERLLRCIADCIQALGSTVFYLELDSARRYKTLTGADLGFAAGEDERYAGLQPGAADEAQARMRDTDVDDDEE